LAPPVGATFPFYILYLFLPLPVGLGGRWSRSGFSPKIVVRKKALELVEKRLQVDLV